MSDHNSFPSSATGSTGWLVGQSIATELNVALTAMTGGFPLSGFPPELSEMVASAPADWLLEGAELLGEVHGFVSILSDLASLAGVLLEGDYSRATLAMRELAAGPALERLAAKAAPFGLAPADGLPPATALVDLAARLTTLSLRRVGLEPTAGTAHDRLLREELGRAVRFLRDGDLSSRFWHWLDRFYYEVYRPWRATRTDALTMMDQHVVAMLGAREQHAGSPPIDWLPPQNPLRLRTELQSAVQAGRLRVFFWIEPFGMADLMHLEPDLILVSFAAPGPFYHNFHHFADDVARRTKALADPTRLIILRLIRNFGMTNTEIASFMEIARPTASVHAKILREAGLIQSRQQGREVHHEIVSDEVHRLFSDLERFLDLPHQLPGDMSSPSTTPGSFSDRDDPPGC